MTNLLNVIKGLPQSFEKLHGRTMLKIDKYMPEMMITGGIISGVAAVITTAYQTMKLQDVLNEADQNEEENKPLETALTLCKLYAVPATLTITSAGLSIGAFSKMKGRYLGAVAAYNGLNASFNAYRERVRQDQGEEKDKDYLYGRTYSETVDEEGNVQNVVEVEGVIPGLSRYSVIFSETLPNGAVNPNWDENMNFNIMFLKALESQANDLLQRRGHVFLNEVYDSIGFPHTKDGSLVGWVRGHGDNFIDFGLYNNKVDKYRQYVDNDKSCLILDFNVDGVIFDLI